MGVCHKPICNSPVTHFVTFLHVSVTFHYVSPYNPTKKHIPKLRLTTFRQCPLAFFHLSPKPSPRTDFRKWFWCPTWSHRVEPQRGALGFAGRFNYVWSRLVLRLVTFGSGHSVSDSWVQCPRPSSTTWGGPAEALLKEVTHTAPIPAKLEPSQHPSLTWAWIHLWVHFLNKAQTISFLHQTWSFMQGHDFKDLMVTFVAFSHTFHYVSKKRLRLVTFQKVTFSRFASVPCPVLVLFTWFGIGHWKKTTNPYHRVVTGIFDTSPYMEYTSSWCCVYR